MDKKLPVVNAPSIDPVHFGSLDRDFVPLYWLSFCLLLWFLSSFVDLQVGRRRWMRRWIAASIVAVSRPSDQSAANSSTTCGRVSLRSVNRALRYCTRPTVSSTLSNPNITRSFTKCLFPHVILLFNSHFKISYFRAGSNSSAANYRPGRHAVQQRWPIQPQQAGERRPHR